MNPSTERQPFDCIICGGGPLLESEVFAFLDGFVPIIFVNYSFERIPMKREAYAITEYGNQGGYRRRLDACPWGKFLTHVVWRPKEYHFDGRHKRMEDGDNAPYLCDYGFTVLTAIHLAVCMGFKTIFGAGVNLRTFTNGRYAFTATGVEHPAKIESVFEGVKWKFRTLVKPDLERLGVTFISEGLK